MGLSNTHQMIGARFYTQLDAAYGRNDSLECELAKEVESARLFRLLTKLSTVVDRAELNGDFGWSEYGDRYMLKLFRDYVFHQVSGLILSVTSRVRPLNLNLCFFAFKCCVPQLSVDRF